jgi:hypothetical protein
VTTASAYARVADLMVDDHACLTFGEPEDLLTLLPRSSAMGWRAA